MPGQGEQRRFPAHGFKQERLAFHKRYGEQLPAVQVQYVVRDEACGVFLRGESYFKGVGEQAAALDFGKVRPAADRDDQLAVENAPAAGLRRYARKLREPGQQAVVALVAQLAVPPAQIGEAALAVQLQLKNEIPLSNAPALKR